MSELIIAGIVTYNPDIERLNQNMESIKKQVYNNRSWRKNKYTKLLLLITILQI